MGNNISSKKDSAVKPGLNGLAVASTEYRGRDTTLKRVPPKADRPRQIPLDSQSRLQQQHGAPPAGPQTVTLENFASGAQYVDTLHASTKIGSKCSEMQCKGSLMFEGRRTGTEPRPAREVLEHARDFIDQYYAHLKRSGSQAHVSRMKAIAQSVKSSGTYQLTEQELQYGAKLAWRNAPRCIGRIQWNKLQLFDARNVKTAKEMFSILVEHMKYATNGGNIRSAITIFPQRSDGQHDFRVWNPLLIRYAGYHQPDGSVIGDPANVEFTKICEGLGWKGQGGKFDVLPVVLQANGQAPEWFELPKSCVLQVHLSHPHYDWFAELGLQWYAVPMVSNLLLDVGGLEFPACPFNGWFMSTEIGCRNLGDAYRYNILKTVASKMDLEMTSSSTLWKDKALVEVNVAVLHSYQKAKVTITDHHSAAESFITHLQNEQKLRGGCPADWVWVVPPMSSSLSPVFHQEMLYYNIKPSFDYQMDPWTNEQHRSKANAISFKGAVNAVKFGMMGMKSTLKNRFKVTILYATETGRSKQYGERVNQMFRRVFNSKLICMEDYDTACLENEEFLLIITSTFGNGDPPENGEAFARYITTLAREKQDTQSAQEKRAPQSPPHLSNDRPASSQSRPRSAASHQSISHSNVKTTAPLGNLKYSVFGLGSTAYPNFCAFAHTLDTQLAILGGKRLQEIMEGDELSGQEASFSEWADRIYKEACKTFSIEQEHTGNSIKKGPRAAPDATWTKDKFRMVAEAKTVTAPDTQQAFGKLHRKQIFLCKLISCQNLQSPSSGRITNLIKLATNGEEKLLYQPGDHAALFPVNREDLVNRVLKHIDSKVAPDALMRIEYQDDNLGSEDSKQAPDKGWMPYQHLPVCSLRQALSQFLEIAKPPSSQLLKLMALYASSKQDRTALAELAQGDNKYEDWIYGEQPTLADVFDRFPSLRVPASLLLTQLPLLNPRYYSISSSPNVNPGEIHLTVAVVKYTTKDSKATRYGVCSTWLNSINEGTSVPVFIRKATKFHMPEDKTAPMILIGPGTGVAPFRSFWQQRQFDLHTVAGDTALGNITLVFGCQRPGVDDLYKKETQRAKAEGVMKSVWTAYSRDQCIPKMYVQDLLLVHALDVFDMITKCRGHIYVCGGVTMAADVAKVIQFIGKFAGEMSEENAKEWLTKLKEENRYHEDIFGITLRTAEVTEKKRRETIARVQRQSIDASRRREGSPARLRRRKLAIQTTGSLIRDTGSQS